MVLFKGIVMTSKSIDSKVKDKRSWTDEEEKEVEGKVEYEFKAHRAEEIQNSNMDTSNKLSESDVDFYASRSIQTSAWKKFKSQFWAFFVKNAIIAKRQWSTTLTKILVPLIIVSLPLLMSIIVDENTIHEDPGPVALYDSPGLVLTNLTSFHKMSRQSLPFYHYASGNPSDPEFSNRLGSMPISESFLIEKDKPFLSYAERNTIIPNEYYAPFMYLSDSIQDLHSKLESFNDFYFHYDRKDSKNTTEFDIEFRNNLTNKHFDYIPSYGGIIFENLPNATLSTKQTFSYLIMSPHIYGGWMPKYINHTPTYFQYGYPQGDRYGYIMSFLHNILARYLAMNQPGSSQEIPKILACYQGFPYKKSEKFPVIDFTFVYVIGFVTLFLLPIYLSQFVRDKQDRHLIMMRINGLNMLNYWIANYLFYFLEYSLIMGIFCLISVAARFRVVISTSPLVTVLLLFCWGWSMISMSAFLSLFFKRVRTALFAGTLLICLGQLAGNMIYNSAYICSIPPFWLMLYPPFSCGYALHKICMECSMYHCYTTKRFFEEGISSTLYWLIGGAVFLSVLTLYLHEVIPQEFGTRKSPLFFVKYLERIFCCHRHKTKKLSEPSALDEMTICSSKKAVTSIRDSTNIKALVIDSVTKIYDDGKVALSDYSLSLQDGEFFGLLGPNGAGKTTLLSILSGQLETTHGKFYLYGRLCDAHRLHKGILGTCPQFDVFYPDLTVMEHLRFYARIRCLDELFHLCQDEAHVSHHYDSESQLNRILHETGLVSVRHQKSKLLCGGMRRRLSLAIALLGNPRIVILDEPTTGLDPCTRRELWRVFKDVNQVGKRTILMTTHAMDEADFLCHRVAIMSSGKILCTGTPEELKLIYDHGYKLTIICSPNQRSTILEDLNERFLSKMDINYMPNYSWNDRLVLKLKLHTYDPSDILTSTSGSEDRQITSETNGISISESSSFSRVSVKNSEKSVHISLHQNYSAKEHLQHKILSKLILYLNDLKERAIITDWGLDSPTLEDVFLYHCSGSMQDIYTNIHSTADSTKNIIKTSKVTSPYGPVNDMDTSSDAILV